MVMSSENYLQLAKKGNLFALHYSLDGNTYKMVRSPVPQGKPEKNNQGLQDFQGEKVVQTNVCTTF